MKISGYRTIYGASFLFISSVFQSLGANIVIHLGFLLTRKFESEYVAMEALLDISYTIISAQHRYIYSQ